MIFPSKSPSSKISPVGSAQEEEKESGGAARRHATGRIPHVKILQDFLGKIMMLLSSSFSAEVRFSDTGDPIHDAMTVTSHRQIGEPAPRFTQQPALRAPLARHQSRDPICCAES